MPREVTVEEGVTIPGVPDNVTDEQVRAGYAEFTKQGGRPPSETGVGLPAAAASGFNEGLARFLGIPGDLARKLVGDPRWRQELIGTGEELTAKAKELGLVVEPGTGAEQFASRVGREVGMAAPVAAATLGAGAVAGPAAEAATAGAGRFATLAKGIWEQLLNLAKTQPAKFAAMETAVAAGGGAGAATGRRLFPQSADTADLYGTLIGSFGTGGAISVLRAAKNAVASRLPAFTRAAAEQRVGQAISQATGPTAEAGLEEATRLSAEIPGVRPTTAQATRGAAPGIETAERAVTAREPGLAPKITEQQVGTQRATQQAITGAAPTGEPQAAVEAATGEMLARSQRLAAVEAAVEQRAAQLTQTTNRYVAAAEQRMGQRLQALGPRADRYTLGKETEGVFTAARDAFESEANRRYMETIPQDVQLPLRPVADKLRESSRMAGPPTIRAGVFDPILRSLREQVNAVVTKTLQSQGIDPAQATPEQIAAATDAATVPFAWVHRWQSDLKGRLRDMGRSANPNEAAERAINRTLDGVLEVRDATAGVPDPAVAEAYKQLSAWYKDGMDRLFRGTVGTAMKSAEQLRLKPEDFLAQFFKSGAGATTAVREYVRGGGPMEALSSHAIDDFVAKAIPMAGGEADPATIARAGERWLRSYQSALTEMPPTVRQQVEEITNAAREAVRRGRRAEQFEKVGAKWLKERRGEITRSLDDIERSVASDFIKADAGERVSTILRGPDRERRMRELVDIIGTDERGLAGLRRAVWDHMGREISGGPMGAADQLITDPERVRRFLADNRAALRVIFPADQLDFLNKIQRVAALSQPTRVTAGAEEIREAMSPGEGRFLTQLWSRAWGVARNVVSPEYTTIEQIARRSNAILRRFGVEHLQVVIERALLDPAVARDLMLATRTTVPEEQVIKKIHGHLATLGFRDSESAER